MVFGTPTTAVRIPSAAKCSARYAAFVFESSPPTTTTPSRRRSAHVLAAARKCASVSNRRRPLLRRWNPPWLRCGAIAAASRGVHRFSTRPAGPPRKPTSAKSSGKRRERQSNIPAATLCPPGAGPPLKSRPRRTPRRAGTGRTRSAGASARTSGLRWNVGVSLVSGKTWWSARTIRRPPRSPTSSEARRRCSAGVGAGSSVETAPGVDRPVPVPEASCTAYRKNTVSAARHSGRTGSYASRARCSGERSSMDIAGGRGEAAMSPKTCAGVCAWRGGSEQRRLASETSLYSRIGTPPARNVARVSEMPTRRRRGDRLTIRIVALGA